jgi:hypothetical protein
VAAGFGRGTVLAGADRTVRYLSALSGASTTRVLNLAAIALANADNPEHKSAPFFTSPIINASIVLKHRVRSDETYLFPSNKPVATKIIIPFDNNDLRSGGRSFFVDQRGFIESLREVGNYGDKSMEHDLAVLRILNTLPSLDPFLLREHLRSQDLNCAACYFKISTADQQKMTAYVSSELNKLISLATGGGKGGETSTARLVGALLSNEVDEKLEPLRQTLMMNAEEFREGVFSWRGFLYYKWSMENFWPEIIAVLKAIRKIQPVGALDFETRKFLSESQRKIISQVRDGGQAVKKILSVYDAAYDDLVQHQAPKTFREFLLSAPHLFLELGEKMGAISHIVSFWRYRFPKDTPPMVDAEELTAIFQDFCSSFAADPVEEAA